MIMMPDLTRSALLQDLPGFQPYLGLDVDLGAFADEQSHHVCVALLRCQMKGSDALLGHDVGLGAVLKQNCGDFHLVLLGGDVERRVAILARSREGRRHGRGCSSYISFRLSLLKDSLTLAMVWGEAPLSRSRSATFWLS